MGTNRGGRGAWTRRVLSALGREYITMEGLLIETRNDLPATFHSTFIPQHFSLSAELTLRVASLSLSLSASDIFLFPNYSYRSWQPMGHCSILPRCHLVLFHHVKDVKVYARIKGGEIESHPFHPPLAEIEWFEETERRRARFIFSGGKSLGRLFPRGVRRGRPSLGKDEIFPTVYVLRAPSRDIAAHLEAESTPAIISPASGYAP